MTMPLAAKKLDMLNKSAHLLSATGMASVMMLGFVVSFSGTLLLILSATHAHVGFVMQTVFAIFVVMLAVMIVGTLFLIVLIAVRLSVAEIANRASSAERSSPGLPLTSRPIEVLSEINVEISPSPQAVLEKTGRAS